MTNTRKLTLVAVLSALSFILMFYQFSFLIDFFKIDLSIIAILLALVLLDFKSAFWVTLIRSVLKLALNQYHWSSCFCSCFCMDLEQGTDPWSICPGNDCWNDQLEYYDGIGELCLCNPFVCSLYEL